MKQESIAKGAARRVSAALEEILEARKEIREEAQVYIDQYWVHHIDGNRGLKPWEGSILGVRAKKGANSDFYVQWFWNRWFKDKGGQVQTRSTYIRKGNGFAYSPRTLEKYAKDWEVGLVLHLESRFAEIRERLRDLKLAEMALRRVQQKHGAAARLDEKPETSEPATGATAVE